MLDYAKLYDMKRQAYERRHTGEENYIPFPEYRYWLLTIQEDAKADAAEERYNNDL